MMAVSSAFPLPSSSVLPRSPMAFLRVAALSLALLLVFCLLAEAANQELVGEAAVTEGQYHLDRAGGHGSGSLKSFQCGGQCRVRCSRTQYKKPCLFFCNKCCVKCLCVPPGFYGNKGVCPCYNNWKTKRGGPKCP